MLEGNELLKKYTYIYRESDRERQGQIRGRGEECQGIGL